MRKGCSPVGRWFLVMKHKHSLPVPRCTVRRDLWGGCAKRQKLFSISLLRSISPTSTLCTLNTLQIDVTKRRGGRPVWVCSRKLGRKWKKKQNNYAAQVHASKVYHAFVTHNCTNPFQSLVLFFLHDKLSEGIAEKLRTVASYSLKHGCLYVASGRMCRQLQLQPLFERSQRFPNGRVPFWRRFQRHAFQDVLAWLGLFFLYTSSPCRDIKSHKINSCLVSGYYYF